MENFNNEIWKDVVGYDGLYSVSNTGRIRSNKRLIPTYGRKGRFTNEFIKKLKYDKNGYKIVMLCKNGITKTLKVHRLVAYAFIENNDKEKNQVNHINLIKDDNRIENLEWVTSKENKNHYMINCNPIFKIGSDLHNTKLNEKSVLWIREQYRKKSIKQVDMAKMFNMSKGGINNVIKRQCWKYI